MAQATGTRTGRSTRSAPSASSWAEPVRTGPVGGGVRLTTTGGAVDVDVVPDFVLAERLTGLARRRQLVELVLRQDEPGTGARGYGVLTATWHRLPRQRRIPLAAALALSVEGVPTHLRLEATA